MFSRGNILKCGCPQRASRPGIGQHMELTLSLPVPSSLGDITNWSVLSHWAHLRSCCTSEPKVLVTSIKEQQLTCKKDWANLIAFQATELNPRGERCCHSNTVSQGCTWSMFLSTDAQQCPPSALTDDLQSEGQGWVCCVCVVFFRFSTELPLFSSKKKKSLHTKMIPIQIKNSLIIPI